MLAGSRATVHELCTNRMFSLHWGLLRAKSRFLKLLKTLETKISERTIGEDSGSLQAGGRRFDPGHVHHILNNLQLVRILTRSIVRAGGLVFIAGTFDPFIRAFDVETGMELWKAQLPDSRTPRQ
jgi:hypothetical protein